MLVPDKAKRTKIPGPVAIVLKEETIYSGIPEEYLGNRFVASGREPCAPEITTADMHGDDHIRRAILDGLVDHVHIVFSKSVQIKTTLLIDRPFLFGAELSPACIVKLKITASRGIKRSNSLPVDCGNGIKQLSALLILLNRPIIRIPDRSNEVRIDGEGIVNFTCVPCARACALLKSSINGWLPK